MDITLFKRAVEAQFLMGHVTPSPHTSADRRTIVSYSWEEDAVRVALHVPLDDTWGQRILDLELQHLATFCVSAAPVTWDADGTEHEIPGWRDQPREEWGSMSIHPAGVLRLAELYGRPYVRLHESPALLAHWQLVQAEAAARVAGLAGRDEAQWAREWPERAILHRLHMAEWEAERDDGDADERTP